MPWFMLILLSIRVFRNLPRCFVHILFLSKTNPLKEMGITD